MEVSIGEQLKQWRLAKGLSQADVSEKLNLSRQTLSKWELDKSLPDLASLRQLAVLYDFSLDDLLAVAAEKKASLRGLTVAELTENLARQMAGVKGEIADEQRAFIEKYLVQDFMDQIGSVEEILWTAIQKNSDGALTGLAGLGGFAIPLAGNMWGTLSTQASKDSSKLFLELFPSINMKICFLTDQALYLLDVLQWLEEGKLVKYPLVDLEFFAVGRYYKEKYQLGNPPAFGYRGKNGHYGNLAISATEMEQLRKVMNLLDPERKYYVELSGISLKKFMAQYAHRKYR